MKELIAGVDEVGIGPLAGPVVAAAVVLGGGITRRHGLWRQVRESKSLTPNQRSVLVRYIRANVLDFGVGLATHREIDALNILQASLLAMRRAVEKLERMPKLILVDGRFIIRGLKISQQAVINGDAKILAISAASILAKVYRDELMVRFAREFPEYGFERHKGYGTALHLARLKAHGPCPIHRMTFAPVRAIIV